MTGQETGRRPGPGIHAPLLVTASPIRGIGRLCRPAGSLVLARLITRPPVADLDVRGRTVPDVEDQPVRVGAVDDHGEVP
ncbi:hypothetical protein SAM40697_6663 [Streptomyces ambofaciens]|uniref:Uncharacterized protein n=1 Tax=Streptomyces ambofaciens TaxID=1889 RepID=A0ABN4PGI1_STRAM|nr:hypothetical protein [Streptomyces ambofaciens]ANB10616.1 hypothetical protein SAM40697_6663 [Streptomyces ambofaciens]